MFARMTSKRAAYMRFIFSRTLWILWWDQTGSLKWTPQTLRSPQLILYMYMYMPAFRNIAFLHVRLKIQHLYVLYMF